MRIWTAGDQKASSALLGAKGGQQELTETRGPKINNDSSDRSSGGTLQS